MALSITKAAVAFDQSAKSAADLKTFVTSDPSGAATWLAEVAANASNAPVALRPLADAFKSGKRADDLTVLLKQLGGAALDEIGAAISTAKAQTAAVNTIGWTATNETPSFVGFVEKGTDGIVRFRTNTQTFDLDLTKTNWREELETAFMRDVHGQPQVMTIKGMPSADGKRLFAIEFAPGVTRDFISGRVAPVGPNGEVSITWGSRQVKVTNPEFAALLRGDAAKQLAAYDPVGVILPLKPGYDDAGNPVIDTKPDGFFILGRLMKLNIAQTPDGNVLHEADTGYFRGTAVLAKPDLKIPPQTAPDGAVFDANDGTKGSTAPGQGPRAFFYCRILPHDLELPAAPFSKAVQRRIQIIAVSDQADNGTHSPTHQQPTTEFGTLASIVPASAPEHTKQQGTIDPTDN